MKKFMVFWLALTLPFYLLHSQEAESLGVAELTVVPRIDYQGDASAGEFEHSLGASALYTLLEGNLGENLSYSICNHWLSAQPSELYQYAFRSDWSNWCDWANISYSIGDFTATVGKSEIFYGGLEFDEYDYDFHPIYASSSWNNLASYQWAINLSYAFSGQELALQVCTSPFGERPFKSKLYSLGANWSGEAGPVEWIYSYSRIGMGEGEYLNALCLGDRANFFDGVLSIGADWFNTVGDENLVLAYGTSLYGTLTFDPSDKFQLILRGGYESSEYIPDYSGFKLGAAAHWFPLASGRDLRCHLVGGYSSIFDTWSVSVGLTYYLNLSLFKK